MEPIHFPCPQCGARPGERCTNYRKQPCAPHRKRTEDQYAPVRQKRRPRPKDGPAFSQGQLFSGGPGDVQA